MRTTLTMQTMMGDRRIRSYAQPDQTSRNRGMLWLECYGAFAVLTLVCGCTQNSVPSSSPTILSVDATTFEREVLQCRQPVLVEFWAPWCQPCLEMAPDVERVAQEFSESAKVVQVRIDENEAIAARFGVKAPPTVVVFQNASIFKVRYGRQTAEEMSSLLRDAVTESNSAKQAVSE